MTDARFPDKWLTDRRLLRLSDRAFRLFANALMWTVSNRTDGVIEAEDLPLIPGYAMGIEDELARAGLWVEYRQGWLIADYKTTQTSRDELRALDRARHANRNRQALFRDPELRRSIRARDGDDCRYCGREVDWNDRRSSAGGTYDHVDPDGRSTYENAVVACRGCNSRKGHRTPEQARMPLLPIPDLLAGSNSRSNSRSKTVQAPNQASTQDRTGQVCPVLSPTEKEPAGSVSAHRYVSNAEAREPADAAFDVATSERGLERSSPVSIGATRLVATVIGNGKIGAADRTILRIKASEAIASGRSDDDVGECLRVWLTKTDLGANALLCCMAEVDKRKLNGHALNGSDQKAMDWIALGRKEHQPPRRELT